MALQGARLDMDEWLQAVFGLQPDELQDALDEVLMQASLQDSQDALRAHQQQLLAQAQAAAQPALDQGAQAARHALDFLADAALAQALHSARNLVDSGFARMAQALGDADAFAEAQAYAASELDMLAATQRQADAAFDAETRRRAALAGAARDRDLQLAEVAAQADLRARPYLPPDTGAPLLAALAPASAPGLAALAGLEQAGTPAQFQAVLDPVARHHQGLEGALAAIERAEAEEAQRRRLAVGAARQATADQLPPWRALGATVAGFSAGGAALQRAMDMALDGHRDALDGVDALAQAGAHADFEARLQAASQAAADALQQAQAIQAEIQAETLRRQQALTAEQQALQAAQAAKDGTFTLALSDRGPDVGLGQLIQGVAATEAAIGLALQGLATTPAVGQSAATFDQLQAARAQDIAGLQLQIQQVVQEGGQRTLALAWAPTLVQRLQRSVAAQHYADPCLGLITAAIATFKACTTWQAAQAMQAGFAALDTSLNLLIAASAPVDAEDRRLRAAIAGATQLPGWQTAGWVGDLDALQNGSSTPTEAASELQRIDRELTAALAPPPVVPLAGGVLVANGLSVAQVQALFPADYPGNNEAQVAGQIINNPTEGWTRFTVAGRTVYHCSKGSNAGAGTLFWIMHIEGDPTSTREIVAAGAHSSDKSKGKTRYTINSAVPGFRVWFDAKKNVVTL